MKMEKENKRVTGSLGEEAAVQYLIKNKYKILERNFRYKKMGEIDIISRENNYLCFIEVKTRSSASYGLPREAVNYRKQEGIRKLAQVYLNRCGMHDENIRFDVIEVYIEKKACGIEVKNIELIKNAF